MSVDRLMRERSVFHSIDILLPAFSMSLYILSLSLDVDADYTVVVIVPYLLYPFSPYVRFSSSF